MIACLATRRKQVGLDYTTFPANRPSPIRHLACEKTAKSGFLTGLLRNFG